MSLDDFRVESCPTLPKSCLSSLQWGPWGSCIGRRKGKILVRSSKQLLLLKRAILCPGRQITHKLQVNLMFECGNSVQKYFCGECECCENATSTLPFCIAQFIGNTMCSSSKPLRVESVKRHPNSKCVIRSSADTGLLRERLSGLLFTFCG